MTATELAALIVALACVVAVVLLACVLMSVAKALKQLRAVVELLRTETAPVALEPGATVRDVGAELERVAGDPARSGRPVSSAPRLAYGAFSNPIIKGIALASGTGQAARSLRRKQAR